MKARSLTKHLPLLIMSATSGAIFLANLIAKKNLPNPEYEQFSYIITIASILSSFALLGTEQLIIRFSQKNKNTEIPSNIIIIVTTTLLISTLITPIIIRSLFNNGLSILTISSMTIAIGLSLIAFNLNRISESFTRSQVFQGLWRVALLAVIIYLLLTGRHGNIESATTTAMLFIISVSAVAILSEIKNIKVSRPTAGIKSTALAFSLSLGIMTILGGFDRVLAENTGIPKLFSDFVHLSMFLIFPFNIISSYIGLKEGVYFKKEFSRKILFSKISKISKISVAIYTPIALMAYLLKNELEIHINIAIIIICLLLASVKSIYSLASSAMGATGSPNEIWTSNVISGTATITTYTIASTNAASLSIELILIIFLALWAFRTGVFILILERKCLSMK